MCEMGDSGLIGGRLEMARTSKMYWIWKVQNLSCYQKRID